MPPSPVDTARALAVQIRSCAATIEADRALPAPLFEALVDAGLFYLLLLTLGMPWSLVLIAGATALGGAVEDLPVWTGDVMVVLAAVLNLELHRRLRRRRARRYDDGLSGLAED